MALSGSLTTNAYNGVRSLTLNWSATQNISANTSTINWTLVGSGSGSSYYMTGPTRVVMDGAQVHYSTNRIQLRNGTVVASGSHTIGHNGDGTRSFSIRIEGAIYSYSVNCTAQQSFTLNQIPRKATITGASNFYDDENPTITISNPAKGAATVNAYIEKTGVDASSNITIIYYGAINPESTSVTFVLNDEQRKVLQGLNTTSNVTTVRFVLNTKIGNTYNDFDWRDVSLKIRNPNPTLNPTVVDSNSKTIALTGSNSKLVKYYSNAKVTFGANAVKGASLRRRKVTCGNKSLTADGTINGVENGKFSFSVTDSRGNTTTKSVTKTMVNYVKLSCNIGSSTPDASGRYDMEITGAYFYGSFGAVDNTLTVQYRYRVQGTSTWGAWTAVDSVQPIGFTYLARAKVEGLDYQTAYEFQARATDKLATVTASAKTVKSLPTFDWSETDFNFNVPVTVQGVQLCKNNVLWSGAMWPDDTQTLYLSSPVSEQQTGIVLVFSAFDGKALDYDFNAWFVPKWVAQNTHNVTTAYTHIYGEYISTKSIYVHDTFIWGIANNKAGQHGPTKCGITTTNNKQALRYVIGV